MNNNYFWFAIGGLSTLILIVISNLIGVIIIRKVKQKEQKVKEGIYVKAIKKEMGKEIGGCKSKLPTCYICKEEFDKGSHWLVLGDEYWFCFRCGLEGEIEKFVKTEYARARHGRDI